MLTHSKEVAADLEVQLLFELYLNCTHEKSMKNCFKKALIKKIGKERVKIICSGPQDQLDIIKSKMDGNCKARARLNIALHYCVELISH